MNTNTIYRIAGISALVAGILFTVIQLIHPTETLDSMNTAQWEVTHVLSVFFPVFAMLGLTGIYARQIEESGKMGFIGFLLLFGAFSLMLCFGFYEAFIAPLIATASPSLATDIMSILDSKAGPGLVGEVYQINGMLYLLGGLVFAIATIRARVYPQYAGLILGVGVLVTLSAAALPFLARPSAAVFSIGFGLMGVSLIRLVSVKR